MRPNPRTADYPEGSPVRLAQEEFNNTYCLLLFLLEDTFNGSPSQMRRRRGDVRLEVPGPGSDEDAER
ncbi:hypothetical protein [Nocardia sp. bgisy134]|uniref:hypothetical protein n=1 Tax=Nocardia sp. bgisy134 TaxID=3413789 RepID=UPI003D736280